MQNLNQDLKSGTWKQIYLLYGNEPFLRRSYKNRLKEAIISDDAMNYSYFEGKDLDFSVVKDMAETLPFFSDKRLIIIEDSGLFKSTAEEWVEYLPKLPDSTYIIFVESEIDKRGRLYKRLREIGYAADLSKQDEASLKRWIIGNLSQNGQKITREALDLFLFKTGDEMENIKMELDKLIAYCINKDGITPVEVEEICTERTTNRIFEMIEAVSVGNEQKALNLYYDLLALKEPSMRILFLIARQFNQLMVVKGMAAAGKSKEEIAAILKLKPFIAGKLMNQAKVFQKEQLREYVTLCVDSEEAVKTGNLTERIAVEMVIVKIARR